MRKKAKYIVATLLMFCFATSVKAEQCSYERQVELGEEASTVKVAYEMVDYDTGYTTHEVDEYGNIDPTKEIPVIEEGVRLKIMNITEDIYVRVIDLSEDETEMPDDYDNEEVSDSALRNAGYYYYGDSDNGIVYLNPVTTSYIHQYKLYVYATDPECGDKSLRTIDFNTPMYNSYSGIEACKNIPEFEYCQKYVTTPIDISIQEFTKECKEYEAKEKEKNEEKNKKTISNFYKKNKKVILIAGGCILIVGVATAAIIVIRRRSRLI